MAAKLESQVSFVEEIDFNDLKFEMVSATVLLCCSFL